MAGKKEEADHVSSYSNWKNLVMSNHFLRLLGVPLTAGSVAFEEVDVYMHHPAELFGSEPAWKHKFFFTNRLRNQPRADRARAKARGGYWLRTGKRELVKEIDGTPIGSKEQLVFNEGMYVKDSKKTNWYMNEYMMFEEQPLKSDDLEDDNKKVGYKDRKHQFSFIKDLFVVMVTSTTCRRRLGFYVNCSKGILQWIKKVVNIIPSTLMIKLGRYIPPPRRKGQWTWRSNLRLGLVNGRRRGLRITLVRIMMTFWRSWRNASTTHRTGNTGACSPLNAALFHLEWLKIVLLVRVSGSAWMAFACIKAGACFDLKVDLRNF